MKDGPVEKEESVREINKNLMRKNENITKNLENANSQGQS